MVYQSLELVRLNLPANKSLLKSESHLAWTYSRAQCLWTPKARVLTEADRKGVGKIPMTFIRGPIISSVGEDVDVLAIVNNQIS